MDEKGRITSIDLWKFIFVVVIAIGNLNQFVWSESGEKLIFTGGQVLVFFMILSGYFLMSHFKKNQKKKDVASQQAWKFAGKRFSAMYPALLGGVLLAFIVRNLALGTKITTVFASFMNSIWEFIGLAQVGVIGFLNHEISAVPIAGTSVLWNGPLWIISAILIASVILYYIVSKNEDFFAGFFAPIFIIITYGCIGLTDIGLSIDKLNSIGLPNGLARVMAGMCVGMLLYYFVEYFRKKKFSEVMTMLFSLLHISIIMFFIYTLYKGVSWSVFANGIIVFLFCFVLLVNKDYISALYNKSKICAFLGKISLYYYACHIGFVFLLSWLFPDMSYHASIVFNILFSGCWAFIMMYVDDYVITPIFRNSKKVLKKKNA